MFDISSFWIYVLIFIAVIWIAAGLRLVADHERIAVFIFARFSHLKGPGLLFKLPGSASYWERLSVGNTGEFIGNDMAKFDQVAVPIKVEGKIEIGQQLRLIGFRDSEVVVTPVEADKDHLQ